MYTWLKGAIAIAAVWILGLSVWGFSGLTKHAIVAIDNLGDSARTATTSEKALGETAIELGHSIVAIKNDLVRPCKGPAGPDACGAFAQINKVAIASGDAVITTQMQVRSVTPLMIASAEAVNGIADAATGFLTTSREAVDQLNDDKTGIAPMMAAYLDDGRTLNDLLKRKAVTDTLDNVAGITKNLNGVTFDFARATKKATDDYVLPKPWYMKLANYGGDTYDLVAFLARRAK
jgi:hypothetical protein